MFFKKGGNYVPNFLQSKGFQHRLKGGLFLTLVTIPSYFLFNGLPFRIVITLGLLMAFIELYNVALKSTFVPYGGDLSTFATLFLALATSIIAVWDFPVAVIGGVAVVSISTDIFAYFGGKILGGSITKLRPFPEISPNKTWEGTFIGLICGLVSAVLWAKYTISNISNLLEICFFFIPPFAVAGDLLESYFKRRAGVKDSNEYLTEVPIIRWIEGLLGGKGGHGGYLDRLDSFSFVLALIYLVSMLAYVI